MSEINHSHKTSNFSNTSKLSDDEDKEVNYDDSDHNIYPTAEQPYYEPRSKYSVRNTWQLFTAAERRNIAIYIAGIMLYKFGLEAFNGSIIALATNRYDYDAERTGKPAKTFERVGLLVGLNQAFQYVEFFSRGFNGS